MKPNLPLIKLTSKQDIQTVEFTPQSRVIDNKLIKQNIKTAKTILKKCFISPDKPANNLPHYLIIGPQASGKSCLLEASCLHFIEQDKLVQRSPEGITSVSHSNWWVTNEAVFIDVPGYYLEHAGGNRYLDSLWVNFIKLIKKNITLKGILIVIDIPLLINSTDAKAKTTIDLLFLRLQELAKIIKHPIPFQLICTKLDVIEGFAEFFDDLSKEEREQGCGVILSDNNHRHVNMTEQFADEFDKLLKRLNERVIQRLHQTHSINKKSLIKNFCLQFSSLSNNLKRIVFQLAGINLYFKHVTLNGVFFCSSRQTTTTTDLLFANITNNFKLQTVPEKRFDIKSQPYFIKPIFTDLTKLLTNQTNILVLKRKRIIHWLILSSLSCIAIAIGLFSFAAYRQQANLVNTSTQILKDYNNLFANHYAQPEAQTIVTYLDSLYQVMQQFESARHSNIFIMGGYQPKTINARISLIYNDTLQTHFSALIKATIEQVLARPYNYPAEDVFNALKTYMMLNNKNHLDILYLRDWLAIYWNKQGLQFPSAYLITHLNNAVMVNNTSFNIDPMLIEQAKKSLNSNPEHILGYMLLKNTNHILLPLASLIGNQQVFSLENHYFPLIFTKAGFNEIYDKIPSLNTAAAENAWIMGSNLHFSNSAIFTTTIRNLYIQDYLEKWQQLVNTLSIQPFINYPQALNIITRLGSGQSPLYLFINTLLTNTAGTLPKEYLNLKQAAFVNDIIHSKERLDDKQYAARYQLKILADYLSAIAQSDEPMKASFNNATIKFSNPTSHDPIEQLLVFAKDISFPLSKWLNQTALNSWQLVLQEAARYISLNWQKQIIPVYLSQIADRYPINKNATIEISRADFEHFFGPAGIIDSFFTTYVKPFIDTNQPEWDTLKRYNIGLPIAKESLLAIERAFLIQKIFFTQRGSTPFTLELIASTPNVASVDIAVDNRVTHFQQGHALVHKIVWAMNNNQFAITLHDHNGRSSTREFQGAWSLLHFIDNTILTQTVDTRHYELEYHLDGHIVKFALTADEIINPFIKGVMESFKLGSVDISTTLGVKP